MFIWYNTVSFVPPRYFPMPGVKCSSFHDRNFKTVFWWGLIFGRSFKLCRFFCNDGAMSLHLFEVFLWVSVNMSWLARTTQKLNRQRLDVLFQVSNLACHCSDSFNMTAFLNFSFFFFHAAFQVLVYLPF